MAWYPSPALVRLRSEINALWPSRDKSSDGLLGDAAHGARKSDHNPDYAAGGIVRAMDIDENLTPGGEASILVAQLIRDSRVAYVIYEGQIWQNPAVFSRGGWLPYSGPNAHRQHVHVSVRRGAAWDSSSRSWGLVRTLGAGGSSGGGAIPTGDSDPVRPATPLPLEDDDMIRISAPNRGVAIIGPGYYRQLGDNEEVFAAARVVSKTLEGNDREFDLWVSLAQTGTSSTRQEVGTVAELVRATATSIPQTVWGTLVDRGTHQVSALQELADIKTHVTGAAPVEVDEAAVAKQVGELLVPAVVAALAEKSQLTPEQIQTITESAVRNVLRAGTDA